MSMSSWALLCYLDLTIDVDLVILNSSDVVPVLQLYSHVDRRVAYE